MKISGTLIAWGLSVLLFGAAGLRLTTIGARQDGALAKPAPSPLHDQNRSLASLNGSAAWPRPLFSPITATSGDVTGAVKAAPHTVQNLPRLIGVITDADQRLALILYDGKIRRVRENDAIGIWTVAKIERRSTVLQSRDQSHKLLLDPPKAK